MAALHSRARCVPFGLRLFLLLLCGVAGGESIRMDLEMQQLDGGIDKNNLAGLDAVSAALRALAASA